jgi:hypothetical protein
MGEWLAELFVEQYDDAVQLLASLALGSSSSTSAAGQDICVRDDLSPCSASRR